jgi:glycosyltransferase involved in cell wall biosynthesis
MFPHVTPVALRIKVLKMTREKIGIVLPALNEEAALQTVIYDLIKILQSEKLSFKIIIVNDGSTDNTGAICDQLKASHSFIDVIHHSTPLNIGTCYLSGAKLLNTEFITWLPADGEIDTSVIPRMLKKASPGRIVIPYPSVGREHRSFLRRSLSSTFTGIMNLLFGFNLNYFNGNAIVPMNIIKGGDFISSGFTINLEIIIYAMKKCSLKPIEISFTLKPRIGGEQKALNLKNIVNVLKSITLLYKRYHE